MKKGQWTIFVGCSWEWDAPINASIYIENTNNARIGMWLTLWHSGPSMYRFGLYEICKEKQIIVRARTAMLDKRENKQHFSNLCAMIENIVDKIYNIISLIRATTYQCAGRQMYSFEFIAIRLTQISHIGSEPVINLINPSAFNNPGMPRRIHANGRKWSTSRERSNWHNS